MNNIQKISPIPQPPSTTDPENFSPRADAILAALPVFQQQLNAVIDALNPLVPDLPGLGEIVKNLEAIRLTGANITSVNATGTGIKSVNTVAGTAQSGALQKVADASTAIRTLSPIAVELAELATHINDLSAVSDKLVQIQEAVQKLEIITAATANIAELVALGSNMGAVLGVFANLDAVTAAVTAATQTQADARAAAAAKAEAEAARDAAKGFADGAAGIAGLPVGTDNGAPLVCNLKENRWVQGKRIELATPEAPGLCTGDGETIAAARGVVRIKPPVVVEPQAGAIPLRNEAGDLEGNVTGAATPRSHAGSHAQGGPDALTPAALGMVLSIPGVADTIVKRNSQGKIEGNLATPQTPSTHAASHRQDGTDPLSLEALGVVISGADPSGTSALLWIKYL